ncbi:nucleotide exchange factor GrpE [Candidatus Roizmanbacteria bacterium]|nr:nucleotide exchange factor GrpE [Candidatus Roizmanbacteria bacterium]
MDTKDGKKQVKVTKEEVYKQKYLRALADYHNFEKRVREEKEELIKNATKDLVVRLLSLLDNLEKAEVFVKDEGLKVIKNEFVHILTKEGIEELDVLGKEFDPTTSEAVELVSGDSDNIVAEVLRKGYKLNNKVIRPAQVKVTKRH